MMIDDIKDKSKKPVIISTQNEEVSKPGEMGIP
jgi:hypothetical protein